MSREKKESTAQVAERLVKPVIERLGLILWDTRFEKEGGGWYLRYFIDKEGGVNIGDCEAVSRAVEKLLDEADPIEQSYVLEVSSPGIERELKKDRHFERYIGSEVCVRLIRAVGGKREYTGRLLSHTGGEIRISTPDGAEMSFPKTGTSSVRLRADYETGGLYE